MMSEEAIALLEDQMNFNRTMERGWGNSMIETDGGNIVNGELYANQHKDVADALELAIAALRAGGNGMNVHTKPDGQPLTLEQLRGMANKPYWHVGMREDSAPPHWSILDPLLAYHPEDYDYGECWIAYAYPPAYIDRDAWEPCQRCGSKCLTCAVNETRKCTSCKNAENYLPLYKYCPKCGRPLTEEAWAALEKRVRGWMM